MTNIDEINDITITSRFNKHGEPIFNLKRYKYIVENETDITELRKELKNAIHDADAIMWWGCHEITSRDDIIKSLKKENKKLAKGMTK